MTARALFLVAALLLNLLTWGSASVLLNGTNDTTLKPVFQEAMSNARRMIAEAFAKVPPDIMRSLQAAEVSASCSVAMLKMMRAFQNLEPWAFRLFDSSGKYPTGVLQGTKSDLGAFDECLETEVVDSFGRVTTQGQYCSVVFYFPNARAFESEMAPMLQSLHPVMRTFQEYFYLDSLHVARMGICLLNDCDKGDLQALLNSVKPSLIDVRVSHCVTNQAQPWTAAQKAIWLFLVTLACFITACTAIDLVSTAGSMKICRRGAAAKVITAFSVLSNTRMLLKIPDDKDSDEYIFRFLHGIRYISIATIVYGHCFQTLLDTVARPLNFLIESKKWSVIFPALACNCVDTFFFISGFLMCFVTAKKKYNGVTTIVSGVVLRHIRTSIPLFFCLMCLYLLPVITAGPDFPSFMNKVYDEISEHWWDLLLQVRNFYTVTKYTVMPHLWYISADFQAFLISLPTFLLLRRWKVVAIGAFLSMSIFACGIATWQIAGTDLPPFLIIPTESPIVLRVMANEYYRLPFYHIVCYFSGCVTFIVMDDFRHHKLSKPLQAAGWCLSAACGLCCAFMKWPWYRDPVPTSELGKLITSFVDRIMWSFFLSWVTLACASGRGDVPLLLRVCLERDALLLGVPDVRSTHRQAEQAHF
ncbi:nose resistant to fluoxetine protein 6-like isoform X2 [Haemaphysalis longicornis]